MLTIRLQRRGRKNDPSFRVIVVDSKKGPKSGNYLEMVGSYDPRTDRVDLKPERITHWIDRGAQVSDTVHNILISQKVLEGKKINVLPKKTLPQKPAEEAAAEAGVVQPATEVAPASVSAPAQDAQTQERAAGDAPSESTGEEEDNAVAPDEPAS